MKKFSGVKPHTTIIKNAIANGYHVDTSRYDGGSDFIKVSGTFGGVELDILVSTWNGKFIVNNNGTYYSERNEDMDGVDWYGAILDLIYFTQEQANQ